LHLLAHSLGLLAGKLQPAYLGALQIIVPPRDVHDPTRGMSVDPQ
jgi:hypothetical protein